ncbi:MAG: glycosyltransferase family 2 protein [Clostridiales bacterium]|nr:glycosyltransferase family 2 protein [Clostridiales bacterium]
MSIKIALSVYLAVALISLILYLPKIRQFFYMNARTEHKIAKEKRKLSLVIPARDESRVIDDLFRSIQKQTYPKEFYDITVIVKDGDDPTVKMAEGYGIGVLVVPEQKCKGDALDGYFKSLNKDKFEKYDAFVIVDADALLTPDYLEELNNALEYDCQIFLSRKLIKNFLGGRKQRSIYTKCSALTYAQIDDLANIYRTKKAIPVNMCGQGMMLRREAVKLLGGWPYRTLTEDYELKMDCFLKGFTSMYYPYAVLYTEEPLSRGDDYARRVRWLTGFSQCDRKYKKQIKKKAKAYGATTEGEREYFYSLVPLIAFIVNTIIAMLAGVGLAVFYALAKSGLWIESLLYLTVLPFGVIYTLLLIYSVMCMRAMRDAFKVIPLTEKIPTVMFAPFYLLEYFPIFINSRKRAKSEQVWQPVQRVSYESLATRE